MNRIDVQQIVVHYRTRTGFPQLYRVLLPVDAIFFDTEAARQFAAMMGQNSIPEDLPEFLTEPEAENGGPPESTFFDEDNGEACYLVNGQVVCPPGHPAPAPRPAGPAGGLPA